MNEFSAEEYIGTMALLADLTKMLEQQGCEGDKRAEIIEVMANAGATISANLLKIGCVLSSKAATRFAHQVGTGWIMEVLSARVHELRMGILDELNGHLFFWVPVDRSEFYQQPKPMMGIEFATHFPSAERDARKAGRCFAFGEYTASVFHLMRVMEIALRAAEASLQLPPLADKNWGSLLARWHSRKIITFPASLPIYTAHEEFYKDIRATLCAVKDAWRNTTMHIERDYEEDEAKEVMTAVRSFTRKLAAKLNERGQFH